MKNHASAIIIVLLLGLVILPSPVTAQQTTIQGYYEGFAAFGEDWYTQTSPSSGYEVANGVLRSITATGSQSFSLIPSLTRTAAQLWEAKVTLHADALQPGTLTTHNEAIQFTVGTGTGLVRVIFSGGQWQASVNICGGSAEETLVGDLEITRSFTFTYDGVSQITVKTQGFECVIANAVTISGLLVSRTSSGTIRCCWADDIVWNIYDGHTVTIGEPVVESPDDFDQGLLTFIHNIGFITPASQFFFGIILVGLTTVSGAVALKVMASGRMKLVLVLSMAALVGVFSVLLGLFPLWVYFVSAVLAATVLKGAGEIRNTWHELKAIIARRAQTIDEDGQPVQEAAVEAPEPVQDAPAPAVEGAD